jgi:hypothetical protein
MLQVFYINVVKVDRDVAHVAMMFLSVCPKCFSSVLDVCCKCFIWMLHIHACCKHIFQVFHVSHTYVVSILSGCCIYFAMATNVFSGVSNVCCKCFNSFRRMLQVFHLSVANVDLGVAHVAVGQPPVVAIGPVFVCMGVEEAP